MRFDLDVGNIVVGDKDIGHIARYIDQFTATDGQNDLGVGTNHRLGSGSGNRGCRQRRQRQAGEQEFRCKATCHGIAP